MTTPAAPAGSTHPCCHPSTVRAASRCPSSSATQPGLVFSGTTSSCGPVRAATGSTRRSAVQVRGTSSVRSPPSPATAAPPAPTRVRVADEPRSVSVAPTTTECSPASKVTRSLPHGCSCTGCRARSRPRVVLVEVGTGCPSTTTSGPLPQGVCTGVPGSATVVPGTSTSATAMPSPAEARSYGS